MNDVNLAGYQISYKATGDWTTLDVGVVTTATINNLTNDVLYSFKIRSKDTSGNLWAVSSIITGTPTDNVPPAVPTGLIASRTVFLHSISINWDKNTQEDINKYELAYRSPNSQNWDTIIITLPLLTQNPLYLLYQLDFEKAYDLKIAAIDNKGNKSEYSNILSIPATDDIPPATPAGFSAIVSDGSVILSWTTNSEPDLECYHIEMRSSGTDVWLDMAPDMPKAVTSYTVPNLGNYPSLDFCIRARDTSGNWSDYSIVTGIIPSDNGTANVMYIKDAKPIEDNWGISTWKANVILSDNTSETLDFDNEDVFNDGYDGPGVYTYSLNEAGDLTNITSRIIYADAAESEDAGFPEKDGSQLMIGSANYSIEDNSVIFIIGSAGIVHAFKRSLPTFSADEDEGWGYVTPDDGATVVNYGIIDLGTDSTFTLAPADLSGVGSDETVKLSWSADSETDLTGYQVEYKESVSHVWLIVSSAIEKTATTYTVAGLTNGTSYDFRVKAQDTSSNWSDYSSISGIIPVYDVAVMYIKDAKPIEDDWHIYTWEARVVLADDTNKTLNFADEDVFNNGYDGPGVYFCSLNSDGELTDLDAQILYADAAGSEDADFPIINGSQLKIGSESSSIDEDSVVFFIEGDGKVNAFEGSLPPFSADAENGWGYVTLNGENVEFGIVDLGIHGSLTGSSETDVRIGFITAIKFVTDGDNYAKKYTIAANGSVSDYLTTAQSSTGDLGDYGGVSGNFALFSLSGDGRITEINSASVGAIGSGADVETGYILGVSDGAYDIRYADPTADDLDAAHPVYCTLADDAEVYNIDINDKKAAMGIEDDILTSDIDTVSDSTELYAVYLVVDANVMDQVFVCTDEGADKLI